MPMESQYFFFLSQLAADPDPNVKSGSELLDRLLKVRQAVDFFIHKFTDFKHTVSDGNRPSMSVIGRACQ